MAGMIVFEDSGVSSHIRQEAKGTPNQNRSDHGCSEFSSREPEASEKQKWSGHLSTNLLGPRPCERTPGQQDQTVDHRDREHCVLWWQHQLFWDVASLHVRCRSRCCSRRRRRLNGRASLLLRPRRAFESNRSGERSAGRVQACSRG